MPHINLQSIHKRIINFISIILYISKKLKRFAQNYCKIDEIMIEQGLDDLKSLNEQGFSNIHMALNVSIRHFQRKDFVDRLCAIFEENKDSFRDIFKRD